MSSIAEHLAAIEFYRTTGLHDAAHNEGWMFLNVHWRDLVAAWPTDEMAQGRDEFEKRVREQHPSETAANRITEWRAALTPSPAPSAAPHQGADALREALSQAACDVLAERTRQINAEGWTPAHDDEHVAGALAEAAACYASHAAVGHKLGLRDVPRDWPWAKKWWKPCAPRRMLVKAGALILAEIERLDRETSNG